MLGYRRFQYDVGKYYNGAIFLQRQITDRTKNCMSLETMKVMFSKKTCFQLKQYLLLTLSECLSSDRHVDHKIQKDSGVVIPFSCNSFISKIIIEIKTMVFILSSGFLIPYRKLARVGFEPTSSCLPCTRSNH